MTNRFALAQAALFAAVIGLLVAVEGVQVWRIVGDVCRIMEGVR